MFKLFYYCAISEWRAFVLFILGMVQWEDYNYDYDVNSNHNPRNFDFNSFRNYRFIKLTWSELDKSAEYTLKFNSTKRGLWIGAEPPKGETKDGRFMLPASP